MKPWHWLALAVVGVGATVWAVSSSSSTSSSSGSGGASGSGSSGGNAGGGGGNAPALPSPTDLVTDPALVSMAQEALIALGLWTGPASGNPNDPSFLAALKAASPTGTGTGVLDYQTFAVIMLFSETKMPTLLVAQQNLVDWSKAMLAQLANSGWVPGWSSSSVLSAPSNSLGAVIQAFQVKVAQIIPSLGVRKDGKLDYGTLAAEILATTGNLK